MIIAVISITAIFSVALALALVRIAHLTARLDLKRTSSAYDSKSRLSKISEVQNRISDIVNSSASKKELMKTLGTEIEKEITSSIRKTEAELSGRYEKIIKGKERTEQLLERKYQKVQQEKKQTETIVRSVSEGLMVVDKKGKVLLMNPAAEKLLDTKREDKINKSIFSDLKDGQMVSMSKDKKDGTKVVEYESDKDETIKTIRASSAVVQDENGKTVGMVSVLTDITKQKELDRMKSNFINTVTHEFRTPIVAMQKSIQVMLSGATGKLNEAQEKFLTIARRNLERLNLLIDDLLNLSKLEERKMVMNIGPYSVEDIVDDVCDTVSTWAKSKEITISKNFEQHLPKQNIDPNRTAQVLNNLLSNAIKFTPQKGKVNVEVKRIPNENMVEITVADSGIGMSQEDCSKVFDKFYQIGDRATTSVAGTGLGLPIAKEIVELQGGKIWAESKSNEGSKFIFTVPIAG